MNEKMTNSDRNEICGILGKWLAETRIARARPSANYTAWLCPYCGSHSYMRPFESIPRSVYQLRHHPNCLVIKTEELLEKLQPLRRKKAS